MPANRPNSRQAAGVLLIALLLTGLFLIPAVSAVELVDSGQNSAYHVITSYNCHTPITCYIRFYHIQDYPGLKYVYANLKLDASAASTLSANPYYSSPVTLKIGATTVGHGTAYYNALFNSAGSVIGCQIWLEIDDLDVSGYVGTQSMTLTPESGTLFNGIYTYFDDDTPISSTRDIGFFTTASTHSGFLTGTHIARSSYEWYNSLTSDEHNVYLTRNVDGINYPSTITLISDLGTITDTQPLDIQIPYLGDGDWTVTSPWGAVFTGAVSGESSAPEDQSGILNLYIQNSQTGALISGARAVVSAGFYDPADLIEVSNTTLAGGTKTLTLQSTGGGLPNPDYYRIVVTADGYNAEMPYVDTDLEAGLSITMILGMEPTAGAPEDENETYVEFYVRDINANPLSDAVVKCGGYTLMTNSAGFTQFDVPKNATYPYTVQKTGYTAVEGSVTVGAASRYPVNVVMGIGTVPTLTPGPTEPGATPTPDTRTNEQKGQAVIDMIADNAEGIGALGLLCLLVGLLKLLVK